MMLTRIKLSKDVKLYENISKADMTHNVMNVLQLPCINLIIAIRFSVKNTDIDNCA